MKPFDRQTEGVKLSSQTLMIIVVVSFLLLVVINQIGLNPVKWIVSVVLHVTVGAIILFFVNAIGQAFDWQIPINPVTAAVAGFLGVPGILTIFIIQWWII